MNWNSQIAQLSGRANVKNMYTVHYIEHRVGYLVSIIKNQNQYLYSWWQTQTDIGCFSAPMDDLLEYCVNFKYWDNTIFFHVTKETKNKSKELCDCRQKLKEEFSRVRLCPNLRVRITPPIRPHPHFRITYLVSVWRID